VQGWLRGPSDVSLRLMAVSFPVQFGHFDMNRHWASSLLSTTMVLIFASCFVQ